LTGNAAQVLWDTDSKTTDTLKKLVSILKSRYRGERQADKIELNCRSDEGNLVRVCQNFITIYDV